MTNVERGVDNVPLATSLTEREQEILSLVGQGWTNQQIAAELVVAHTTVRWYLRQIYAKLGVAGRREAVERAQALGLAAKAAAPPRSSSNLPTAPTPFVGRQAELQALGELLLNPHARLVTILGPGGIGKTRLALALAERQVSRQVPGSNHLLFPDGVWYVSLTPVDTAAGAVAAIAEAVGVDSGASERGRRSLETHVLDHLRRRRLLLVVDNLEHLPEAVPFVNEILTVAAQVKVLATSRQRLQLRGEQLFNLSGLVVPVDERAANVAAAPAVNLFIQTAQRVQPALTADEAALAAIARICRLLDGTPLAIELAASWASVLAPEAIEREVQRGLDILAAELADLPPRHQSMQAALDGSWAQLNSDEQNVLRQLSVFRGGFSRDAAENVAGATLPVLRALVNASWLSHNPQEDRYQVQELVRQYAALQLQRRPDVERAARERHAVYFIAFLHERERDWYGPRQAEVLGEVRSERDNVRRAWRWAIKNSAVSLMAQGLASLVLYYDRGDSEEELRDLLRAAIESLLAPANVADDDVLRRRVLVRLLINRTGVGGTIAEHRAVLEQARMMLQDLQWEKVDVRHEEAFLAYATGNREFEFDSLSPRAIEAFERSRMLFIEVQDEIQAANATGRLTLAELVRRNYERAAELAHEALQAHRALGDQNGAAGDLLRLARLAWAAGRLEEAQEMCREASELARDGDAWLAAQALVNLTELYVWTGAFDRADEAARQARQLSEGFKSPHMDGHILYAAMLPAMHLGSYGDARSFGQQALTGPTALYRGSTSLALAQLDVVQGAYHSALTAFEQSDGVLGHLHHLLIPLREVMAAYPLSKMGEASRARQALAQGLRLNVEESVVFIAVNALPAAALLFAQTGDALRAVEFYAFACTFPHVAESRWFEDVAGRELAELAASLPAEDVAAAVARGRARELWATAEALIAEFGG